MERHGFSVRPDVLEKFEVYEELLLKWQKAINLVGPSTLDDVGSRHFFDSAQMFRYIPDIDVKLVDLGSGAGFPGLVLSLLGVQETHLVESDVRKATFLREVVRQTGAAVTVHDRRVEDVTIENIDVVTARALAPLRDLLGFMDKLATPGHAIYGLFAKGLTYHEEVEKAQRQWDFELEVFPSETDIGGKILRITNLKRK